MTLAADCWQHEQPQWLLDLTMNAVAGALIAGLFGAVFWSMAIHPGRGRNWTLVLVAELVVIGGCLQLTAAVRDRSLASVGSVWTYPCLLPAVLAVGASLRATQRRADLTGAPTAMRTVPGYLKWSAPLLAVGYLAAAIVALAAQMTANHQPC